VFVDRLLGLAHRFVAGSQLVDDVLLEIVHGGQLALGGLELGDREVEHFAGLESLAHAGQRLDANLGVFLRLLVVGDGLLVVACLVVEIGERVAGAVVVGIVLDVGLGLGEAEGVELGLGRFERALGGGIVGFLGDLGLGGVHLVLDDGDFQLGLDFLQAGVGRAGGQFAGLAHPLQRIGEAVELAVAIDHAAVVVEIVGLGLAAGDGLLNQTLGHLGGGDDLGRLLQRDGLGLVAEFFAEGALVLPLALVHGLGHG